MGETEYLLDCLIEECAEVIQRTTKAKRFGMAEIQPEQALTNQERIIEELNDLIGVANCLFGNEWQNAEAVEAKERKVVKYMTYSQECGVLSSPEAATVEGRPFECACCGRSIGLRIDGKYCNVCAPLRPNYRG